jgi:glycosyltransferase involved in cell wall biosynthesis
VKILFVHEVSYRKKVIFEMHEFPELLALKGHEVSFLEFDEGRKFWEKNLAPRQEAIQGRVHSRATVNLYRPFQLGIPGFDRLLATLAVIPRMRRLFREWGFDAVVLYAVPTYGLQTLWFAKKYQVPVMFRALDVSHKIRSSILSPAIKRIEKRIYQRVDLLSANNPAMASYCNQLGQRVKETKVHFPLLDLNHFQDGAREAALRNALGFSENDRVLVYMGSFFYFSGLVVALREFAKLAKGNSTLKFLLIGGGEQDQELRKLAIELDIQQQVVFTGFVGYEDLPRYLKVADVAVNTLESTLVANVAFPNKVLQYLAAGLPVVSTQLEGLFSVFESEKSIVWESDPTSVVRRAVQFTSHELSDLSPGRSTELALAKLSPEQAVAHFEADLHSLAEDFQ